MAVQTGTVAAVTLISSNYAGIGARKAYVVTANFPAAATSDTYALNGVGASLASFTRNGKTNTIRRALCISPGLDTAQQAVYTGAVAVSGDNITMAPTKSDETTLASNATFTSGVQFLVTTDES